MSEQQPALTLAGYLIGRLQAAWHWREELGAALALTLGRALAAHAVGWPLADLALIAVVVGCVRVPGPRRWARSRLVVARRRRRWDAALTDSVSPPGRAVIMASGADRTGEWARIRVAGGATIGDLAARAEALAAGLGVAEVRVTRHPANAAIGRIQALRRDPLAGPAVPWPWAAQTSLWKPLPAGIGEDGTVVTIGLFEHNLLVGGEPGAGKSVAVSQLIAAAALDPTAQLWLLDGKVVELAPWRPAAARFAGNDIFEATELLRQVQTVMDGRFHQLLADRQRKVAVGSPLHLVVIDELAHYLTWPDRRARDAFGDVLRDLVSRGRAAGIVVIAATQKPASDVIPTSLRDLFGYRWALRCTTAAASDTILGSGWATNGISAATIDPSCRGVGWLLHEAGQPVRLRAFYLDDHTIAAIAARGGHLRRGEGHG